MSHFFEFVAPLLTVMYAAVGICYTRWLVYRCSTQQWTLPVFVGMVVCVLSICLAYSISDSEVWVTDYGIAPILPAFNLQAGMIAECVRAFVGLAILVRILGYTFNEETKALFVEKGWQKLSWLDLFLVVALFLISNYHFNPAFAPRTLLASASSNVRTALELKQDDKVLTDQQHAWLALASKDVLFAFDDHPKHSAARIPYERGDSHEEMRERFQKDASIRKVKDQLMKGPFDNISIDNQTVASILALDKDSTSAEASLSEKLTEAYRRQFLGEVFDRAFIESCQMPYAVYGVYSTLAFACIFVPLFWVPLSALPAQYNRIKRSLAAIANASRTGTPSIDRLRKPFHESWDECFTFVSRYAELPLLVAAFLGIELAFASATLSDAAYKMTLLACLALIILGVVSLAASLIIEASLKKVREALRENEVEPDWLKGRDVRAFLEKLRNESFVGAVFGFATASLGLGVVMQILQLLR